MPEVYKRGGDYNRPDTSTYHISPGGLDEGVMNGAESCVGYQG